jgi:hypothetical protein
MAVSASVVDDEPKLVPEASSRKGRGDSPVNRRRDEARAVLIVNGDGGSASVKYDEGWRAPALRSCKSESPGQ